jgi:hypothetical protein
LKQASNQMEIVMYCNRYDRKENKQQTIKWLQSAIPVIMKTQKVVAQEIFLKGRSEMTRFYLS